MPPPPERDAERVAHLVLMALLPAVADGDLATFGAALSAIQAINGRWFAPVQGGTFAPGPSEELVRNMADWGASGVGQSSWGPAVYGIVDGERRPRPCRAGAGFWARRAPGLRRPVPRRERASAARSNDDRSSGAAHHRRAGMTTRCNATVGHGPDRLLSIAPDRPEIIVVDVARRMPGTS
jgi:hypothetical protein